MLLVIGIDASILMVKYYSSKRDNELVELIIVSPWNVVTIYYLYLFQYREENKMKARNKKLT